MWLIIVPVGVDGRYVIPEYELDVTHHLRYHVYQWVTAVSKHMEVHQFSGTMRGLKDNWSHYPGGNLFLKATA
jgi:hypothetical protein